jgi:hypothetical protein
LRIALFLAATALVLVVGAEPAGATVTVRLSGSALRIEADAANDNITFNLDLSTTQRRYQIQSTQPIALGDSFCTAPTSEGGRFVTRCPSSTPTSVAVVLSGGNDIWIDNHPSGFLPLPPDPIGINAGIGNDRITGSSEGSESITGGDGGDSINGDGGFDSISGGTGDDNLDDGDGNVVRQPAHTGFVNTEDSLTGGSGDDTLSINEGDDTALGEDGNDHIVESDSLPEAGRAPFEDDVDGGLGRDTFSIVRDRAVSLRDDGASAHLFSDGAEEEIVRGMEEFEGGRGGDVLSGSLAGLGASVNPNYDGREGPDVVTGSSDPNEISGGNGIDRLFGKAGDDELDAKAGEPVAVPDDVIDCGVGINDKALIDLLDAEPFSCETVNRSAIGEGPHLVIGAVHRVRGRTYAVRLRCPRKLKHRCRGSLELALTRHGLGPAKARRYSIRAGRRRTLRVRVTRRDARRLRRRRARRGFVRSVEKGDVTGRKTTLARRRLR